MPPSPPNDNRDSNGVRASIFDVCYQLGALDDNSLIAEWMFNDHLSVHRPVGRRFPGTTRFQEVLTPVEEDEDSGADDEAQTQRRFPFSLFGPRSRSRSRSRSSSKPAPTVSPNDDDDGSEEAKESSEVGVDSQQQQMPTRERGSFFRRSLRRSGKSEMIDRRSRRSSRTASTRYDSGYASIKSRSILRKRPGSEMPMSAEDPGEVSAPLASSIPSSASRTPPEPVRNGNGELREERGEVEAASNSPKHALDNKGINPSPVDPKPDQDPDEKRNGHYGILPSFPRFTFRSSTAVPVLPSSPSTGSTAPKRALSRLSKSRSPPLSSSPHRSNSSKRPSAQNGSPSAPIAARFRHGHKRSASLPTSPVSSVPFSSSGHPTPSDESGNGAPRQASRVVFADDAAVASSSSSSRGEAGPVYRESMGYHNQFFVRPATFSFGNGKGEGLGSGPVKGKGRMVPFLGMKKG